MSCGNIDCIGKVAREIIAVSAILMGLALGGLSGCADAINPDEPTDSEVDKEGQSDEPGTETTAGKLTISEKKPKRIEGEYDVEEGSTIKFSSQKIDEDVVRVEMRFGSRVFSAVTNRSEGVANIDAYSVETGETVSIRPNDRNKFRGLRSSFERNYAGRIDTQPLRDLQSYLDIWSKYPEKADNPQFFFGSDGAGYELECSEPKCETKEGDSSYSGTCKNPDSEIRHPVSFDDCGHFFCSEDEHMDYWGDHPSSTFDCYGQCGPGCGSLSRTNVYTDDCADHDGCDHRHATVGPLCADEFMKAADDFAFAPSCED